VNGAPGLAVKEYKTELCLFHKQDTLTIMSTANNFIIISIQGTAHVCCSGQGCSGEVTGDCSAIGWVSFGAADSGNGFLGCDCHGIDVLLPGLCEVDRKQNIY
jgi:hypothetical protein